VIVHDLEVRDATANGPSVDDGGDYANPDATRHVVFRGLDIHDIGSNGNQDCLKLSGPDDFWVLSSRFARCGGGQAGSGIDHVGCHDGVIAGNRFEDLSASGNSVQCKGGSTDITIVANHITDGGARAINLGGSTGFEFFRPPLSTSAANAEARPIHVIANLIEGSVVPLAFVGCVDCLAANNTIVDPDNWIVRILQETVSGEGYTFLPSSNGRIVNNLVHYDRSGISTHVNVGGNVPVHGLAPCRFVPQGSHFVRSIGMNAGDFAVYRQAVRAFSNSWPVTGATSGLRGCARRTRCSRRKSSS
jgi:hypothetical protein